MDVYPKITNSLVVYEGNEYYVSDTSILELVGKLTYLKLLSISPNLYKSLNSVVNPEKYLKNEARKGYRPNITDFGAWFIDSRYTPISLKRDLIKVWMGSYLNIKIIDVNERVYELIGSSPYDDGTEDYDIVSWFIIVLISAVVCLVVIVIFFNCYNNGMILCRQVENISRLCTKETFLNLIKL